MKDEQIIADTVRALHRVMGQGAGFLSNAEGGAIVQRALDEVRAEPAQSELETLKAALGNCYVMAVRQSRRTAGEDKERWEHVKRFCELTGLKLKSDILRAQVPTEITDGAEPAQSAKPDAAPSQFTRKEGDGTPNVLDLIRAKGEPSASVETGTPLTDAHELECSMDQSMDDEGNIKAAYKHARDLEQQLRASEVERERLADAVLNEHAETLKRTAERDAEGRLILQPSFCGVSGHFKFQQNGSSCLMCQREHQIAKDASREATASFDAAQSELTRLKDEMGVMREALQFYAADSNWDNDVIDAGGVLASVPWTAPIFSDGGKLASAAIALATERRMT